MSEPEPEVVEPVEQPVEQPVEAPSGRRRPTTRFSERLTVVVRAQYKDAANNLLAEFNEGEPMLAVPLRTAGDTTNTVRAYWASGVFEVDIPVKLAPKVGNVIFREGETVSRSRNYWVFDTSWSPEAILAALRLDRVDEGVG